MNNNLESILSRLFGFFILIAILGGGFIFLLFLVALILGGQPGTDLAVSASGTIMPYFIKAAAIAIAIGLISMYVTGRHTLTLQRPVEKK